MSNNIANKHDLTDLEISYGKKITDTAMSRVAFQNILNKIRTGSGISPTIERIRLEPNRDKQNELKKDLPYFVMGKFLNDQRANTSFLSTEFFILDFDHIGTEQLNSAKEKIRKDPNVFCLFTSPSGDGLKAVYRLADPITDVETYKKVYTHYNRELSDRFGLADKCDTSTKDPARACFLSYDPDVYVNWECEKLSINIHADSASDINHAAEDDEKLTLSDLLQIGAAEGERTTKAASVIGHLIRKGIDKNSAIAIVKQWNEKNTPPLTEKEIAERVNDMYKRYCDFRKQLPVEIIVKNGSYFKRKLDRGKTIDTMMTTFTILPEELLTYEDSDCLKATIVTNNGIEYKNILLENKDWHARTKFLAALGHMDCNFIGSDNDLQALCGYINQQVTVRKKGTKVCGLHDGLWVIKDLNISEHGIHQDPDVIACDKGDDAFMHGIHYDVADNADYRRFLDKFYQTILEVNSPEVMVPWLGWFMACPLKERIAKELGGFPLAFVHGAQGSGKTSTCRMWKRLAGYTDPSPVSCTQKAFPMLKLLSATNGIPVILDEFKKSDMPYESYNRLERFMRKTYSAEVESKGRADQTTISYKLTAPLCVMGEWSIEQSAIMERVVMVRFSNSVKKNADMQKAFAALMELNLESFMPNYIQFAISQDVPALIRQAAGIVDAALAGNGMIAPRIKNNLTVMTMGILLFQNFGNRYGVKLPQIDIGGIIKSQKKEITGNEGGFVRSAVDQLLEGLSVWAMMEKEPGPMGIDRNGYDCKFRRESEWKYVSMDGGISGLAINFKKIFPDFKDRARRTGYEGDLLDERSFVRQFEETPYIMKKDHPVTFGGRTYRSLVVDFNMAKACGLELGGFEA